MSETSKQYKIGVIGAGKIVENNHLPVLKNINNINVEWVYDTNSVRSKLLTSMYGVPSVSGADWEKASRNGIKTFSQKKVFSITS